MSTIKATYNAPAGDAEVVTMRGVRFFDGQEVELDTKEHAELVAKLRTNQHFAIDGDAVEKPVKADPMAKARAARAAKKAAEKAPLKDVDA